jgi:catechol 2,3-dioxygenase-like lactoylglutathione lyase family enzyme
MDLNHIHIGTKNLGKSREFYEGFFGFKKKFDHGDGIFLVNDEDFLIAIDPVDEVPEFPSWFHFGFCLDDMTKVKAIYDKMKSSGVAFAKEYQEWDGEAAAFYCFDPDGYKIEVSWHKE